MVKNVLYLGIAVLVVLPLIFAPHGARVTATLSARPLRRLGDVSYGLFLFHMPLLVPGYAVLHRPTFTGTFLEVFVWTWGGGVLLAAASHHWLELPLMRRWRDFVPERGATPAVEPAPAP